jgi:hypothetical protein
MVRVLIARPLPEHTGQGSSTTMPRPRQVRHGSESAKPPRFLLSCPVPLQVGHTLGTVPALAPVPRQVGHGPSPASRSATVEPSMASPNVSVVSVSMSAPRLGLAAPAAGAEHPAQQVAEPAAGTAGAGAAAEQVTQVKAALAALPAGARHPQPAAAEQGPRVVVLLALFLVGQDVVRLGDLLEALLR